VGFIRAASVGQLKALFVRNVFDYNNVAAFPQTARQVWEGKYPKLQQTALRYFNIQPVSVWFVLLQAKNAAQRAHHEEYERLSIGLTLGRV
jgi:hypothetical protein